MQMHGKRVETHGKRVETHGKRVKQRISFVYILRTGLQKAGCLGNTRPIFLFLAI